MRVTLDDYRRIGTALAAGGPWSLEQLRFVLAALIVRDPAIEPAFHRRFDEFFATRSLDEMGGAEIDVERVLDELRALVADRKDEPRRDKSARPEGGKTGAIPGGTSKHPRRIWRPVWYAAVWMLAAALILALASSTRQIPVSLQEQPKETTITPPPKPAAPVTAQPTAQRRYRNVPFIERIEELDTPGAGVLGNPGPLGRPRSACKPRLCALAAPRPAATERSGAVLRSRAGPALRRRYGRRRAGALVRPADPRPPS